MLQSPCSWYAQQILGSNTLGHWAVKTDKGTLLMRISEAMLTGWMLPILVAFPESPHKSSAAEQPPGYLINRDSWVF